MMQDEVTSHIPIPLQNTDALQHIPSPVNSL